MGARSAGAQSETGEPEIVESGDWIGPAATADTSSEAEPISSGSGRRALAWILAMASLAWLGFFAWTMAQRPLPTLLEITLVIATACIPLVLLGLIWLLFGRSSRGESERFRKSVANMQRETAALESILGIVATRLEENYNRLTGEAAKLMSLGDEASDRLGRVTQYISKETAALDRRAEQLESAANAARVDIGVLLSDLPKAEEQARAVAQAMKQAGLTALGEAGQLESQLSALVARGREADEVVGGTAQRLAAHLARIESSTASAKTELDTATASMTGSVDDTLSRTSDALEAARESLDAQGRAMLAMVEQGRASLAHASEAAGRDLTSRLAEVREQIDIFAGELATQDAASQGLTARLARELAELDQRFTALGQSGEAQSQHLAQSVDDVRTRVNHLYEEVSGGQERAAGLIGRAHEMSEALSAVMHQLNGQIPEALAGIEQQAGRTRAAAEDLAPIIEAVQITAYDAASQAAAAEASIVRQQDALQTLVAMLQNNVSKAEEQFSALSKTAEDADAAAGRLAQETGPELVEALLRVREAASQAAERARETIKAVIPNSAAELATASEQAVSAAVTGAVGNQVEELSRLSERASETARAASERLTRQMLALGKASASVDAQIEAGRREQEQTGAETLSQRVSMLIDSLNSTAIDVAKIMSNEVTDAEWSAYLKGDRGVFTRRAVRLLDNSDAREIGRFYDTDAEFREQVNRYIHDFEGLLRRVMTHPDGNALGITILSSDMGKLYVALAQVTERIRL